MVALRALVRAEGSVTRKLRRGTGQ
jgi:hypothetical protein